MRRPPAATDRPFEKWGQVVVADPVHVRSPCEQVFNRGPLPAVAGTPKCVGDIVGGRRPRHEVVLEPVHQAARFDVGARIQQCIQHLGVYPSSVYHRLRNENVTFRQRQGWPSS